MASIQEEAQKEPLKEKLNQLGYPDYEVTLGEEDVLMLHVQDRLICGVEYALSMPDEALKALIDETVKTPGD